MRTVSRRRSPSVRVDPILCLDPVAASAVADNSPDSDAEAAASRCGHGESPRQHRNRRHQRLRDRLGDGATLARHTSPPTASLRRRWSSPGARTSQLLKDEGTGPSRSSRSVRTAEQLAAGTGAADGEGRSAALRELEVLGRRPAGDPLRSTSTEGDAVADWSPIAS